MSNSTQVVDLFRWAQRNGKTARVKHARRVGLAAALAVVVEHGRREATGGPMSGPSTGPRLVEAAPGVEAGPMVAIRRAPQAAPPSTAALAAMDERVRCPRCGREGFVHADFGLRRVGGRLRAQSWCRACRAEKGGAAATSGASSTTSASGKPAEPVRLDDLPLWSAVH